MHKSRSGTWTVSKVEEYLANADHCEREAKATRDEHVRAEYLKLARAWRELARQLDPPKKN
ncbi:MAG TPA: hypothetical protein VIY68_18580 [Steroidobacteraceae bacterium]